jgi:hypothetical protein
MTVQMRAPAEPVIGDALALDEYLASRQAHAIERLRTAMTDDHKLVLATIHGEATDLRELIAPWVAEAREDAARTAEEERER